MGQDKNEVAEKAVKVSILVAVYNAENSIRKCLDSLTAQTLKDIQVICIDDGSTDKSPLILDEYAKYDKRINVIHLKENQGLAHARNIGLNIARGEYTCMLDSDDWFAPDALTKAVEAFEKHPFTDCVLFKFILVFPDREKPLKCRILTYSTAKRRLALVWDGAYTEYTWCGRKYTRNILMTKLATFTATKTQRTYIMPCRVRLGNVTGFITTCNMRSRQHTLQACEGLTK